MDPLTERKSSLRAKIGARLFRQSRDSSLADSLAPSHQRSHSTPLPVLEGRSSTPTRLSGRRLSALFGSPVSSPISAPNSPSLPSESWWTRNREDIVSSVHQILSAIEKALDGFPVPGAKLVVGGLAEALKLFQSKWANEKALVDLKDQVERILAIIQPYEASGHEEFKIPAAMVERMAALRRCISDIRQAWEERTTKNSIQRHLSAESIAEDIRDLTKKISSSIQLIMFEGSLRVEAAVSDIHEKQATYHKHRQLEILARLKPVKSAFYDAAGSPAECLEGTRVELLGHIQNWLAADTSMSPTILWLNGLAGTGKSTLTRTVARVAREQGRLAASFFFSRDNIERRRLTSIIPTIAYQLAMWNENLRQPICSAIESNPDIAGQRMSTQCDTLIDKASQGLDNAEFPTRALLILDALDECDKEDGYEGGNLLPLLAKLISSLPFRLQILVSSRPEHSIRSLFKESVPADLLVLHAINPHVVQADIRLFLVHEFQRISRRRLNGKPWPQSHEVDALVKLASPLFVFASTAIKFIDSSAFPPQRQLDIILQSTSVSAQAQPYRNLDCLYQQVLDASVSDETEVNEICARFRRIMSAILFLRKPMSVRQLNFLLSIDEIEVDYTLRPLATLLDVPASPDVPVQIFHPSFSDFLSDPTRCTDTRFLVASHMGHYELSRACLNTVNSRLIGRGQQLHIEGKTFRYTFSNDCLSYANANWRIHLSLTIKSMPKPMALDVLQKEADAMCVAHLKQFLALRKQQKSVALGSKLDIFCTACLESFPTTDPSSSLSTVVHDATFRKVFETASHSHVVVLLMEEEHCAALVVPRGESCVHLVQLPHVKPTFLARVKAKIYQSLAHDDSYFRALEMTWVDVVRPILQILELTPRQGSERPHIHWCPIDGLRILPLHVAGLYSSTSMRADVGNSVTDYVVSSYVPNLAALLALQQVRDAPIIADLRACVILGIPLRKSRPSAEADAIARSFDRPTQSVTCTNIVSEAAEVLKSAHILHLVSPRSAFLCRGVNGLITVQDRSPEAIDIDDLEFSTPLLAFLNHAAKLGVPEPGEIMLSRGFASVIVGLWEADDDHREAVATEFYKRLLALPDSKIKLSDIACVLDEAVGVLRRAGVTPMQWGAFVHLGA